MFKKFEAGEMLTAVIVAHRRGWNYTVPTCVALTVEGLTDLYNEAMKRLRTPLERKDVPYVLWAEIRDIVTCCDALTDRYPMSFVFFDVVKLEFKICSLGMPPDLFTVAEYLELLHGQKVKKKVAELTLLRKKEDEKTAEHPLVWVIYKQVDGDGTEILSVTYDVNEAAEAACKEDTVVALVPFNAHTGEEK